MGTQNSQHRCILREVRARGLGLGEWGGGGGGNKSVRENRVHPSEVLKGKQDSTREKMQVEGFMYRMHVLSRAYKGKRI